MPKKKRQKGSKAKAQKKHARWRCMTRYGVTPSDEMLNAIGKQIRRGKAHLIEKQSGRVSVWAALYDQRIFKVVYDRQRKSIATFLPIAENDGNHV